MCLYRHTCGNVGCTNTDTYVYTRVCIHVYVYTRVCIHVRICTYMCVGSVIFGLIRGGCGAKLTGTSFVRHLSRIPPFRSIAAGIGMGRCTRGRGYLSVSSPPAHPDSPQSVEWPQRGDPNPHSRSFAMYRFRFRRNTNRDVASSIRRIGSRKRTRMRRYTGCAHL